MSGYILAGTSFKIGPHRYHTLVKLDIVGVYADVFSEIRIEKVFLITFVKSRWYHIKGTLMRINTVAVAESQFVIFWTCIEDYLIYTIHLI